MSSSLRRGFLALVVVGPAFLVGCHADPPVTAQIEPVLGAAWDADQVARDHLNGHHRSIRGMNVKQSASRDDEAHFVFIV